MVHPRRPLDASLAMTAGPCSEFAVALPHVAAAAGKAMSLPQVVPTTSSHPTQVIGFEARREGVTRPELTAGRRDQPHGGAAVVGEPVSLPQVEPSTSSHPTQVIVVARREGGTRPEVATGRRDKPGANQQSSEQMKHCTMELRWASSTAKACSQSVTSKTNSECTCAQPTMCHPMNQTNEGTLAPVAPQMRQHDVERVDTLSAAHRWRRRPPSPRTSRCAGQQAPQPAARRGTTPLSRAEGRVRAQFTPDQRRKTHVFGR